MIARRAENQCRSNDGRERNDGDHHRFRKHGQAIAYQTAAWPDETVSAPAMISGCTQYRILGSMKAYATSTSRLQTRIVIEINATMPRIRGSSRFRFALMK